LLLDRKRIKKWSKWIALALAIIFAISFVGIGVGQSGGGNVFETFSCSSETASNAPQTPEEKLAAFQAALTANPADVTAMLGIAGIYQEANNLKAATVYLENVIALDPSQKDIYIRLANLYMSADLSDFQSAATVLNKATSVDPSNPDVYLKLGSAQNSLGNTEAALLAWQKYLELAPNGDMASVVREQITKLSAKPTTTTTAGATTTTSSGTASTSTTTTAP